MIKLINSKATTYHHEAINDFSDESKFVSSGSSKGHAAVEFSWISDFLFKKTGNTSANPHIGYLSFVSDRDIMYEEYGNVERIWSEYPSFSERIRNILSEHAYELETKQYSKIGQKYEEYDLIEYINASKIGYYDDGAAAFPSNEIIRHDFYRAPCFYAAGYKIDRSYETPSLNLDQYIWINELDTFNYTSAPSVIREREAVFSFKDYGDDLSETNDGKAIIDDYIANYSRNPYRLISRKFNIANPKWLYFDHGETELVFYHYDSDSYQSNSFKPYYGFAKLYDGLFNEMPIDDSALIDEAVIFFPQVIVNGILEPCKLIVNRELFRPPDGGDSWEEDDSYVTVNTGAELGERDDQSIIVYNVCKRLINLNAGEDRFEVQRKDGSGNIIYPGIDVDTERNRRYSPVVMTEPYMVTEPVADGTLVDYMFVDSSNNPIEFYEESDFVSNPDMFVKISAPLSVVSEIDRLLNTVDINTDIMHVLSIEDPSGSDNIEYLQDTGDYYDIFGNDEATFFRRQDDCLDDLLNGIIGSTNAFHKKFYIDNPDIISDEISKYTDSEVKVCGAGFHSETITNDAGAIIGTVNFLNLYCNNYIAVNNTLNTGSSPNPIANDPKIIVTDDVIITRKQSGEYFRPMIKLPGMNGYVKILKRNTDFATSRALDGRYEIVYNVEFPYCPGSYYNRATMNFVERGKLTGFIYKKTSYIDAGPQEIVGEDGRYDIGNDRHVPYADDSFTASDILLQLAQTGLVQTDKSKYGGKRNTLSSPEKDRIGYPADVVWGKHFDYRLLSLTKSQLEIHKRYGTYNINLLEDLIEGGALISDPTLLGYLVNNNSGTFGVDIVDRWITLSTQSDGDNVYIKTNESGKFEYWSGACPITKPIEAFEFNFAYASSEAYVDSLEIRHNGERVAYTDFTSGMKGWFEVGGSITLVPSPDGSGKLVLKPSGELRIRKYVDRLFLSEGKVELISKVWYYDPGGPSAMTNSWRTRNKVRMDLLVFNGDCIRGGYSPANDDFGENISLQKISTSGSSYVQNFSRDMKLMCLADNQKWKFADDKFSSYIGRENPSFVCEMNISALLNDYTEYQKDHGAIPDIKRWLNGYFSGFAHMMSAAEYTDEDNPDVDNVSTIESNVILPSDDVKSNIAVEIWDAETDIGNDSKGNWRPFMSIASDLHKIPGTLIIDNIYIGDESAFDEDNITTVLENSTTGTKIYSVFLGHFNFDEQTGGLINYNFPNDFGFDSDSDPLDGEEDLVLYDTVNKKSFHIAYIKTSTTTIVGDSRQLYRAYIKYDPLVDTLEIYDSSATGDTVPVYEIRRPFKTLTKNPHFNSNTIIATDGLVNGDGFLTRYLDLKSEADDPSDFERFVTNGKIFFRIRVSKRKDNVGDDDNGFPTSYIDKDASEISYVGEKVESEADEWLNYPWSNGTVFDAGFDWAKIKTKELIRKFGLSYFKCISK